MARRPNSFTRRASMERAFSQGRIARNLLAIRIARNPPSGSECVQCGPFSSTHTHSEPEGGRITARPLLQVDSGCELPAEPAGAVLPDWPAGDAVLPDWRAVLPDGRAAGDDSVLPDWRAVLPDGRAAGGDSVLPAQPGDDAVHAAAAAASTRVRLPDVL